MQLNKIYAAIGSDRETQAANIIAGSQMWKEYEEIHANAFLEAKLEKYVVVNADGQVVNRSADKAALMTNADGTLRHEDFLVIQDRIVEVRRRALNGISDLMESGLTFNADIGQQLVGFENINEFKEGSQEMNPNTYDNNDTAFTESYTPNPITHSSFSVPWRQTGFDYKRSLGLRESTRQVAEKLDETLFNGNDKIAVNFNGSNHEIFGYTNHPSRGTGTISDWTLTANQDKIVPETIEQVGKMWATQGGVLDDSVVMYVANDIWEIFQKDYVSGFPSKTIKDRIMDITQIRNVKPAEKLAAGQVVLVEMDARSIELAVASDIIAVPHQKTNPFAPQVFTTYAAMVHQIKVDSNNKTGVRHLTV